MNDVQRALRLPVKNEYFLTPSFDECRVILENLNYDFKKQKNYIVLCLHLPTTWKSLIGVLGKCLTTKIRSLDQMNTFEQCILYSVVKNKQLDFAQLIFYQMGEIIVGAKRSTHVSYPQMVCSDSSIH